MSSKALTLVAGYLGAGKTTLINRMLAVESLRRTAVVVNDFGSINIDAAIVASSEADTIELTNGCICCQIGGNVQQVMSELGGRRDIDHVICEVSGVGDPAQLRPWTEFPGFRPGGVLVCVDAVATAERLRNQYVADVVTAQIRGATVLAITKTDLAHGCQASRLREICADIAGEVPTFATSAGAGQRYPSDDFESMMRVLVTSGTERTGSPELFEASKSGVTFSGRSHEAVAHHSLTVALPGRVDVESVRRVLTSHVDRIVRAKGIVLSASGEYEVIHLAGNMVRVGSAPTQQIGSIGSHMVLIGAGPNAGEELRVVAMDLRGLCGL